MRNCLGLSWFFTLIMCVREDDLGSGTEPPRQPSMCAEKAPRPCCPRTPTPTLHVRGEAPRPCCPRTPTPTLHVRGEAPRPCCPRTPTSYTIYRQQNRLELCLMCFINKRRSGSNHYQRLTLETWFTNLGRTPLNRQTKT